MTGASRTFKIFNPNALTKKVVEEEARRSTFTGQGVTERIRRIFFDFDGEAIDEGASAGEGGAPDG